LYGQRSPAATGWVDAWRIEIAGLPTADTPLAKRAVHKHVPIVPEVPRVDGALTCVGFRNW